MSQIKQIKGKGIAVVGNDIDTDRIIPARFLRCITFDGLGNSVFEDDRSQSQGNHPFDLPQYRDATILVVNGNFGCGSSREHAPQAIARWGIKAIVGESFAEIFLGNCVAIGLPCVTAEAEIVQKIQTLIQNNPESIITVDLTQITITYNDIQATASMNEGSRQMFLNGSWDSCGQLVSNVDRIQATAANLAYLSW
jgi:3-isopropylmalate/(R)-2-methylmalate dehydratase small subunit